MSAIIMKFAPLIKKAVRQINDQDQDDLEQKLVEKIISVVLNYDLSTVPNFSEFCNLDLDEIFLSLKGEK